ncbi:copper resistance CopC family protein [Nocardia jejuensis]|uniref:copper resistance CopC family protein n=1 Tax=Nocardia jejuensis TaxID=328049 RepID=UPI00082EB8F5|nr:copper resistance CopC family protein [Nocardia jejuensis]
MTVVTLATAGTVFAAGGAAEAHTSLNTTDPGAAAVVTVAPQQVTLTFASTLLPEDASLTVTGPDGLQYQTETVVSDAQISTQLKGLGPAGIYTVAYSVRSDDGHLLRDGYGFLYAPVAPASNPVAARGAFHQ